MLNFRCCYLLLKQVQQVERALILIFHAKILIVFIVAPPKSAHKHGLSLSASKGRTSASPLPSTPEQPPASASPPGPSSLTKGHASVEDNVATQATGKEKASSSEKGTPSRVATTALLDKPARKGNLGLKPTDLRSMLISLLTDNPRGMSLKVNNCRKQNYKLVICFSRISIFIVALL